MWYITHPHIYKILARFKLLRLHAIEKMLNILGDVI